jgi:phage terminase large subunit-like protein
MGLRGPGANKIKRRLKAARSSHPWDKPGLSRAEKVVAFIESLPCSSGPLAGTNFKLRPWQKRFIRAVYKVDGDRHRIVRTAVLSMGRANGKTALASALALCHLAGPEAESRGEVYAAANDRFQSSRVFNELAAIIQRTAWLKQRLSVRRYPKEIEDFVTGSIFVSLSADAPTKAGLAPSFVVVDELGQAKSRELFDVLATALGKRAEPLLVTISTQASRDEAPLSQLIDYGLRIARREISDPSFHLTFFAAPRDDDPWKLATWKKANPALGDFRSLEDVRRLARQAQRMPAAELSFRRLILNQRVDTSVQFIDMQRWKACGQPPDLNPVVADYNLGTVVKNRPCFAGLDLGSTKDMTALVLAFSNDDGVFDVLSFCWLPGETLQERQDQDNMPYRTWVQQGHLLTFPGRSTDPKVVALKIAELHGRYKIQKLAFDRWRIEDIRRELDAIGCHVELEPFGQGYRDMSAAVDKLERLVDEGKLRGCAHPVLTMAAANVKVEMDAAKNRKPTKVRSTGRIDPIVALIMALGVATRSAPVIDVSALIG